MSYRLDSIEVRDASPELLEHLAEDATFQQLLLRQHNERSALSARHAQEYVKHVASWHRRRQQGGA